MIHRIYLSMHHLHFELIGSLQMKIILLPRTQVYHEADMVIFCLCGFSSHFPTSPTLFKVIAPLTCCVWNESLSPTIFLVTSTLILSLALPALCPEGQNSCPSDILHLHLCSLLPGPTSCFCKSALHSSPLKLWQQLWKIKLHFHFSMGC